MAEQPFQVPIVHQDLRQEESIVQMVDSLKYMQACANCVFTKIDARLTECAGKLHSIQARISVCREKVERLASTKKATKVLSSAKYPASETHAPCKTIFSAQDKIIFQRSDQEIKSKIVVPYKHLQEKMQFFHVKNNNKMLRKNLDIAFEEGLGKLPKNITSVSSLLLFNTTENPYKSNLADRFGLHYRVKHAASEPEEEPKPKQVVTPMKSTNTDTDSKVGFYSPSMVQVPELNIPMDLPMPGIADGLEFLMDFDSPGAFPGSSPAPPAAPAAAPVKVAAPPVAAAAPPAPKPPEPPTQAQPLPPPPPALAPALSAPAPPPPPPPPAVPSFVEAASTSEKKPAPAADGDMRASLMAAIRQAGGSGKLKPRSMSEKKMESKKKKEEEKKNVVSGDLMADLHAKLQLRRTGISGQNKQMDGGGLMEKISAMIPPPPVAAGPQHCDSEEGSDWDP